MHDSSKAVSLELVGRYSKLSNLPILGQFPPATRCPIAPPRVHNAQKRLALETVDQLIADYQARAPSTALMAKYNIDKGIVLKILEDQGISRRNQPLSPDQCAEAIELYLAG